MFFERFVNGLLVGRVAIFCLYIINPYYAVIVPESSRQIY